MESGEYSDTQAVLISIDIFDTREGKKQSFLKNKIERVEKSCTFRNIYDTTMEKFEIVLIDDLKVYVSAGLTRKGEIEVDSNETLSFVAELFETKSIYFLATRAVDLAEEVNTVTAERNAFELMMAPPDRVLGVMEGDDMNVKLHNVLRDMQGEMALLSGRVGQKEGERLLKKVTDAIWYLDGRKETINNASKKRKSSEIISTPQRFEKYSGYQNWTKWKKKPRLEEKDCDMHASLLISAVENDLIRWPADWKEDIVRLSSSLSGYAKASRQANEEQQSRQSKLHPARQFHENATGQYWPSVERGKVHTDLIILSEFMENCDDFEPVLVEDEHFQADITPAHKLYLLGNIALTVPVQAIRYNSEGGASALLFLQNVPSLFTEEDKLTQFMRMLKTIEPQVPIYHTRAMRKQFAKTVGSLHSTEMKPHVIRHIYRTLTRDSSKEIDNSEIDNRVRLAIETEDSDLIIDLRHLNKGRQGDTFELFFKELALIVE